VGLRQRHVSIGVAKELVQEVAQHVGMGRATEAEAQLAMCLEKAASWTVAEPALDA
jgi:hypothetical protein